MRPTWSRVLLAVVLLLVMAVMVRGEQQLKPPIMPLIMPRGAMITHINPGSPAEQAQLEVGDIIVSVNGIPITSEKQLFEMVRLSLIVQLRVVSGDDGRPRQVMVYPMNGDLGVQVKMVGLETGPLMPTYRPWI